MAAGGRDNRIGGGADLIQQYLNAGLVNEFTIAIAPVVLARALGYSTAWSWGRSAWKWSTPSPRRVIHLRYAVSRA